MNFEGHLSFFFVWRGVGGLGGIEFAHTRDPKTVECVYFPIMTLIIYTPPN